MLTKRYMSSVKNVSDILAKIVTGTAPSKFTAAHLKTLGFAGTNDRAIIPLLKDLGFLGADGTPTKRYHDYRNPANSRRVLGEALREAYEDVFHLNAKPTKADREAITGVFKSVNNLADRLAELQTTTFFALLDKADVSEKPSAKALEPQGDQQATTDEKTGGTSEKTRSLQLRHNIEVHLPATKDIEVYNAIFKALREHLLD
ncbi:hypothetical protein EG835_11700 [bacterium]|nr:hypothetical protein [bacterium]